MSEAESTCPADAAHGGIAGMLPGHPVYDHPTLTTSREHQHRCVVEEGTGYIIPGAISLYTRINSSDFTVNPKDIWVLSYPKSGTTWTWEILLNLHSKGDADKLQVLRDRYHKLGTGRIELKLEDVSDRIRSVNSCEEPRVFGSHLPDAYVPDRVKAMCKVIVVMRNPKDTCVSWYHFHRMNKTLGQYTGTFSQFYQAFINNQIMYGSWFDYTINMYQQHKNDTNFLFLKFENIKKDPRAAIVEIANHLNMSVSDDEVTRIVVATSFKEMKEALRPRHEANPMHDIKISEFLRKGEVGDWKNHFTVADSEHFDAVYREKIGSTDLTFNFE